MARLLFILIILLPAGSHAGSVASLARCSTKVFADISRTGKWSGTPPAGCPEQVKVEQGSGGIVVTVWGVEQGGKGWTETSFSATVEYRELAAKKELARANRDIASRAARLERCLRSLQTTGDPLECDRKGSRDYLADEESGVEDRESLRLRDGGRACEVQVATGDIAATPTPPVTMGGEPLPPGVNLEIYLRNGGRAPR